MAVTLAAYISSWLAADTVLSSLTRLPPPPVPIVALSPKRWRCDTGWHHWHTSEVRARCCAFSALPLASITWQRISQPWAEAAD